MGIRMTLFAAPRSSLEELAATTIGALARREGLAIEPLPRELDLPRLCMRPPGGETLLCFDEPDLSVGAHLAREPSSARALLRWLSGRSSWRISIAIEGHRRWWVGSLAHTLERHGFRGDPAVGPAFGALRTLVRDYDTGCPWLDGVAPLESELLGLSAAARRHDLSAGEIEGGSLEPLLAAAAALDRFEPPAGPIGIAPPGGDIHAWTTWVSGNVAALARASSEHLVSIVS